MNQLDSFDRVWSHRGEIALAGWTGGEGPAVVLLHGYPQTHQMWHRIAPMLAQTHCVVMVDLRGYGESSTPPDDAEHTVYSKREMAVDVARLMQELGHATYDVVGHDRGGRVGHRLALDFPARVTSLAVLDIVPTLHMFENVDRAMADAYFHWFFLTRPEGLPEALIAADPGAWMRSRFDGRQAGGLPIDPAAFASYVEAFTPDVIAASCADYRAAASVDLVHDREDRAAENLLAVPLLAAWGAASYVGRNFDVPAVWSNYAQHVSAAAIDADHYLAEENPSATIEALTGFWKQVR